MHLNKKELLAHNICFHIQILLILNKQIANSIFYQSLELPSYSIKVLH
jgi:hypothetical protein